MSPAELAQLDALDRVRCVERALADERRGRSIRAAQLGRTDAIDRNIARLTAELDAARLRASQTGAGRATHEGEWRARRLAPA